MNPLRRPNRPRPVSPPPKAAASAKPVAAPKGSAPRAPQKPPIAIAKPPIAPPKARAPQRPPSAPSRPAAPPAKPSRVPGVSPLAALEKQAAAKFAPQAGHTVESVPVPPPIPTAACAPLGEPRVPVEPTPAT